MIKATQNQIQGRWASHDSWFAGPGARLPDAVQSSRWTGLQPSPRPQLQQEAVPQVLRMVMTLGEFIGWIWLGVIWFR